MKKIALLTALATAAPLAVAYADPPQTYQRDRDRDYDHDRDRDAFRHDHYDRFNSSRWASENDHWVRLVRGNAATGRHEFVLGSENRYRTFRLESLTGDPMIRRVRIDFANGATQNVDINTAMPAGSGDVIDLRGDNRRIQRIVVYADPHSRGAYAIYGT